MLQLPAIGYRLYGCYVRQRTVRHVVAQYDYQMLHEFLTSNRDELIKRCREKVAKRYQPSATPAEVDNGVPLFLQQLTDTLRREQVTAARDTSGPQSTPANSDVGFAAALHGAEMLRLGFSVDQVVHEYGDVCQSVTDMAVEQKVLIAADQFRTLNRCLDDAIADAVSAYGRANQTLIDDQADNAHARLRTYAVEHRRLVDIALESFSAIRTGNVGTTGATSTLLLHTLGELRTLTEQSLPTTYVAAGNTNVARH